MVDHARRLEDLAHEWWEMCDDIHKPLLEAASHIDELHRHLAIVISLATAYAQGTGTAFDAAIDNARALLNKASHPASD